MSDSHKIHDEYWDEFIPAMLPTYLGSSTDGDPKLAAAWLGWSECRKLEDADLARLQSERDGLQAQLAEAQKTITNLRDCDCVGQGYPDIECQKHGTLAIDNAKLSNQLQAMRTALEEIEALASMIEEHSPYATHARKGLGKSRP